MQPNKPKNKLYWQLLLYLILAFGLYMVYRFVTGYPPLVYNDGARTLIGAAWLLAALIVTYYMQIAVHEAGHLIFGLLSGYRFISYRFGSHLWSKKDGKLRHSRYRLPGTSGQCLMSPPAYDNGNFPQLLYNLGGIIANITLANIALILCLLTRRGDWLSAFFFALYFTGLLVSASNGVPLFMGGVANDGANALAARRDKSARRSFWLQLHYMDKHREGVRLRDLPEDMFAMPPGADLHNHLVPTIAVMRMEQLMDSDRYEDAWQVCQFYRTADCALLPYYYRALTMEQLYMELVGPCRREIVDSLFTKEMQQIAEASKKDMATGRRMYAYHLLYTGNRAAAQTARANFEKATRQYPYKAIVQGEREMLVRIDSVWKTRQNSTY